MYVWMTIGDPASQFLLYYLIPGIWLGAVNVPVVNKQPLRDRNILVRLTPLLDQGLVTLNVTARAITATVKWGEKGNLVCRKALPMPNRGAIMADYVIT